ncbi:hypothetical protein KC347_g207 [Hortaea werneckii]|nr:hypothetical protein KC347_g207 [Hortaea werneckii]
MRDIDLMKPLRPRCVVEDVGANVGGGDDEDGAGVENVSTAIARLNTLLALDGDVANRVRTPQHSSRRRSKKTNPEQCDLPQLLL